MDLQAYLDRIRYAGAVRPDLSTLRALHRAHLYAIPYENLDVQFGRATNLDPAAAFEKIVGQGRGGWCYEMNGLFGWALETIGFRVTRLAGAVMREALGSAAVGNHLLLLVHLDEPWIADVGLGDGCLEPIPLRPGPLTADGFTFRLEQLDPLWWRLHNHDYAGARSCDFIADEGLPGALAAHCHWLQTDPESAMVTNLIVQRFTAGGLLQLRGRILRILRRNARQERLVESAEDLVGVLAGDFRLHLPEAGRLWPRIVARHAERFARVA